MASLTLEQYCRVCQDPRAHSESWAPRYWVIRNRKYMITQLVTAPDPTRPLGGRTLDPCDCICKCPSCSCICKCPAE